MSQENLDLVCRQYEALERLDVDAMVGFLADDFEFDISAHPLQTSQTVDEASTT